MAATSFVTDRGRAFGLVAALAISAALVMSPTAFGAVDGDPIATSTLKVKLKNSFKKQLKRNGVKMKPKKLAISGRGESDVDPTTGQGDLLFKTIKFSLNGKGKRICKSNGGTAKQCKRKVVYKKLRGSMPGTVKGEAGKLFKLTAPSVTRNGFGADVTGVKVKFLRSAAKSLNRQFQLNSLKPQNTGSFSLSYQPETVKVLGGASNTTSSLAPGSLGLKLFAHCVSGLSPNGVTPIAPATSSGIPPTFVFPVTGGDLSPTGEQGLLELAGGVRINKNNGAGTPAACAAQGPPDSARLTQVELNTNVTERTVSSVVNIEAALPNTVFPGPRGRAVGQTTDPSTSVVTSDPVNKTISINGTTIRLAEVSAQTLNGLFPNASGDPAQNFAAGDPFGTSNLTVNVR